MCQHMMSGDYTLILKIINQFLVQILPPIIYIESMVFNPKLVLDKIMKRCKKIDDISDFDFIRYTLVEWA